MCSEDLKKVKCPGFVITSPQLLAALSGILQDCIKGSGIDKTVVKSCFQ